MSAVNGVSASENRLSYPALYGLRGIAVLVVFGQHYFGYSDAFNWRACINVFFVLSGFLITGILWDTRDAEGRFRNFYARRTLRIFPLFYAVLLLGLLLYPIFHWAWHPSWLLWPVYLGNYGRFLWHGDLVQETAVFDNLRSSLPGDPPFSLYYGHLWSLCVEEQFYLIWPFVVFLVRDRDRLCRICIAAITILPLARLVFSLLLPPEMIAAGFCGRVLFLQCDSLLLGGLLALAIRGPEAYTIRDLVRVARPVTLGLLAFATVFSMVYVRLPRGSGLRIAEPMLDSLGYTLVNVFAAALIALALHPGTLVSRVLQWKPLLWLGSVSYGFYVFHEMPHMAYERLASLFPVGLDRFGLLTAVFALAGTTVLAYLSRRFIEKPFLKLNKYFVVAPGQLAARPSLRAGTRAILVRGFRRAMG